MGFSSIHDEMHLSFEIWNHHYFAFSPLHALLALGFPIVLIPWVVLQELDSLKRGKGLSGSVAHLATPAISYIYNSLKNREPHLWGQSMQQAAESSSEC